MAPLQRGCHLVCMWSLKKPKQRLCQNVSVLSVHFHPPQRERGNGKQREARVHMGAFKQVTHIRTSLLHNSPFYLVLAASKTSRKLLVNQPGCSHCCFSDYLSTNICCPLEEKGRNCISLNFYWILSSISQRSAWKTRIS